MNTYAFKNIRGSIVNISPMDDPGGDVLQAYREMGCDVVRVVVIETKLAAEIISTIESMCLLCDMHSGTALTCRADCLHRRRYAKLWEATK